MNYTSTKRKITSFERWLELGSYASAATELRLSAETIKKHVQHVFIRLCDSRFGGPLDGSITGLGSLGVREALLQKDMWRTRLAKYTSWFSDLDAETLTQIDRNGPVAWALLQQEAVATTGLHSITVAMEEDKGSHSIDVEISASLSVEISNLPESFFEWAIDNTNISLHCDGQVNIWSEAAYGLAPRHIVPLSQLVRNTLISSPGESRHLLISELEKSLSLARDGKFDDARPHSRPASV
jgi:hypothetical protein